MKSTKFDYCAYYYFYLCEPAVFQIGNWEIKRGQGADQYLHIFICKLEKILEDSLDSIPSPSTTVKIQNIGGKVYLR